MKLSRKWLKVALLLTFVLLLLSLQPHRGVCSGGFCRVPKRDPNAPHWQQLPYLHNTCFCPQQVDISVSDSGTPARHRPLAGYNHLIRVYVCGQCINSECLCIYFVIFQWWIVVEAVSFPFILFFPPTTSNDSSIKVCFIHDEILFATAIQNFTCKIY
jgi:hypothetical protein